MQDLHSTRSGAENVRYLVYRMDDTAPTQQHELDHARSRTDDISALKDLDHDLYDMWMFCTWSMDDLSKVCVVRFPSLIL